MLRTIYTRTIFNKTFGFLYDGILQELKFCFDIKLYRNIRYYSCRTDMQTKKKNVNAKKIFS